MKTALDTWLSTNPTDEDAPERRTNESWYDYARRWWFHWASKDAEKSRTNWGKGKVDR